MTVPTTDVPESEAGAQERVVRLLTEQLAEIRRRLTSADTSVDIRRDARTALAGRISTALAAERDVVLQPEFERTMLGRDQTPIPRRAEYVFDMLGRLGALAGGDIMGSTANTLAGLELVEAIPARRDVRVDQELARVLVEALGLKLNADTSLKSPLTGREMGLVEAMDTVISWGLRGTAVNEGAQEIWGELKVLPRVDLPVKVADTIVLAPGSEPKSVGGGGGSAGGASFREKSMWK